MGARYRDLTATRGDAWRPPPLAVYPSVAAFNAFWCTIRTSPAVAQPDDTDVVGGLVTDGVVGQVTLAGGGITILDAQRIQIVVPASVTRLWSQLELYYDVQARLIADGFPYTLVRGRLAVGWAATQTP